MSVTKPTFQIISDDQVEQMISMQEAVQAMVGAFTEISSGDVEVPIRNSLGNALHTGMMLSMPCYSKAKDLYSVKVVTVFPENGSLGLPMIQGKILLLSAKNGTAKALVDAQYLTALRTGAASGLATKILSQQDASVLAVVGTGRQAILQVAGVMAVRNIRKVLVKGKSYLRARSFCELLMSKFGVETEPIQSEEELLQADIICTATNSISPVIDHRFVKPGAHINAIGGYRPDMQELPSELLRNAFVVVDQVKACLEEAGDIIVPMREGILPRNFKPAELGELLLNRIATKKDSNQISIFKSVGNAAQDLALGHLLLTKEQM